MHMFGINIYDDIKVIIIMYARILSDTRADVWITKMPVSMKPRTPASINEASNAAQTDNRGERGNTFGKLTLN